jgi:outer membrane protein assembly factor BamB
MLRGAGRWLGALVSIASTGVLACALCPPAIGDTGGQSVAYQLDPAHDGWLPGATLAVPAAHAWTDMFGNPPSYPLIANGAVYVVDGPASASGSGSGLDLYALNPANGAILWQHPLTSSAGLAYDAGRVFVVDGGGLLTAFDAASGAIDWSVQLPGQYAFSAPPTAANGIVYVGGAGTGGTLYATNEANGALLWSQPVENGDTSSPALDAANVYVTYPGQYYAFNRSSGAGTWHDQGTIEGGGGWTPVVADGHLFVRDTGTSPKILSSSTGGVQGPLTSTTAPAVANGTAYELDGSTLNAVADDGLGSVSWSFAGDGQLDTAPLVIGSTVWVGSASGLLYALDGASGRELWSINAGAAIDAPNEYSGPLRGMAAADGLLLVPAGSSLVAYGAYAPGATSPTRTSPPATTPAPTHPLTPAALLRTEIVLRHLTVRALLRSGRARLRITAQSAARVVVRWFYTPAHASKRVVLVDGSMRIARSGERWLTLHLTRSGRRALRRARHGAAILAQGQLAPVHGRLVKASARFRLRG